MKAWNTNTDHATQLRTAATLVAALTVRVEHLEELLDGDSEEKGVQEPGEYTLAMDPEEYLERYPDGPNAAAARAAIASEGSEES